MNKRSKKVVHPDQPLVIDKGVVRFKANPICRWLIDSGRANLNEILMLPGVTKADHAQFAQLIGYSVSGYGDLSYVSNEQAARADRKAGQLLKSRRKKK